MAAWAPRSWRLRTCTLDTFDHTLVMGIVNVTPDSFSDGGTFSDESTGAIDHDAAIGHAQNLVASGADLIDVGGESTRPGAAPIDTAEELERVLPVVASLARDGIPVSIDTSKPEVARAAVEVGAEVINDVTGLRDPQMIGVAVDTGAGVVIMHMQGVPQTMHHHLGSNHHLGSGHPA